MPERHRNDDPSGPLLKCEACGLHEATGVHESGEILCDGCAGDCAPDDAIRLALEEIVSVIDEQLPYIPSEHRWHSAFTRTRVAALRALVEGVE
jgi:hypothetical protein